MQYVFGSLFLGSSRFKLCRKATKTIRHQEIFADNIAGRPSIFSPSGDFCLQNYAPCMPYRSTIEVNVHLKSNKCSYAGNFFIA